MNNETQINNTHVEESATEQPTGIKKILNIIGRIFSWIIIAFAVFSPPSAPTWPIAIA